MKPYPKYRDSGVEWIGNVPEHWDLKRLKYVCRINPSKTTSQYSFDMKQKVTFLPMEAVSADGCFSTENKQDASVLSSGFTYFEEGDVIFAKITPCFENGKGAWLKNLGSPFGFGSTEYHVLRATGDVSDAGYLYFLTMSHVFRKTGEAFMTGVAGQKRVSNRFVEDFRLGRPTLPEQQSIALFLDDKTKQIDLLIEKKQKQIDLLKEERTAIISEAVTKGLNPKAKMKDSGIEWIGEIPEHWEADRLSNHAIVKARLGWKGLKAEEYVDEGYIFLSTPNIKEKEIDFVNVNFITEERYDESPEIMLQMGDVLIAKDGSTLGTTNVIKHLPLPATVNSSIAVVRPKDSIAPIYLYYLMISDYTQNVIHQMKDGQGVPHLFQADLRKFRVLIPPLAEQHSIVSSLDQKTSSFDTMIAKEERLIVLLQEYRTSLISEVVTGKIDVRSEAVA